MIIPITVFWITLLTNNDRIKHQLPQLTLNRQLTAAAQSHAYDLCRYHYFAHTMPDGTSEWNYLIDAGYLWKRAGENLAANFDDTLEQEHAWMESKGHRENILNPFYQDIGVGICQSDVVVMFGTKH